MYQVKVEVVVGGGLTYVTRRRALRGDDGLKVNWKRRNVTRYLHSYLSTATPASLSAVGLPL